MQAFLPGNTACSVVGVEHGDAYVRAQMYMLLHTTTHTHSKHQNARRATFLTCASRGRYSARCKHKSSGCANCASVEKGCAGTGQCGYACPSLFPMLVFSQGRAGAGEFAYVLTGHPLFVGLAPCARDPLPQLQRRSVQLGRFGCVEAVGR